jgi:hypothetical protein
MKRILFALFLFFSMSAMAQKANDNCIIIRYSDGDALDKVRDGFSKEQLGALDITLVSVKEEVRGSETVVTCKGRLGDTPVTIWARVSANRVVLFGNFNNNRMYYTGNEQDDASFYFLKLAEMPAEHMFFPSDKVFYKNSSAPWNE